MAGGSLGEGNNVLIHGCDAAGLSVDKINRALKIDGNATLITRHFQHRLKKFLKIKY